MAPLCSRQSAKGWPEGTPSVPSVPVDAGDAAVARLERFVVPFRLRADEAAEPERLAGDRELLARVVDDLEEQPGVRAALVGLAGRVEVARAVAVRHDEAAVA